MKTNGKKEERSKRKKIPAATLGVRSGVGYVQRVRAGSAREKGRQADTIAASIHSGRSSCVYGIDYKVNNRKEVVTLGVPRMGSVGKKSESERGRKNRTFGYIALDSVTAAKLCR